MFFVRKTALPKTRAKPTYIGKGLLMRTIAGIQLKNPLILAPMAGVTDAPFRRLCARFGASLTYTEMVSAKGLAYQNEKTRELLAGPVQPAAAQLFGSDPDTIAAESTSPYLKDYKIIDINMGCPARKIVAGGDGAALMKDPGRIYAIVSQTVAACKKPVTVKIRAGWDDSSVNAPEIAALAEKAGAAAVTVHGRTAVQAYSGKADLGIIAACVRAVSLPVIGNGDVTCGPSAARMLEETGCAAVMIGRAAQGAPYIFQDIAAYLETGKTAPLSFPQRLSIAREHAESLVALRGEHIACRIMRKHVLWYTKGFPGAAALRDRLGRITTLAELNELLSLLLEKSG